MAKSKITQKEAIFHRLYANLTGNLHRYIPVFDFMGEYFAEDLKLWGFISHECSARLSEINSENPDLLQVERKKAKAGGTYFCYRLRPDFSPSMIKDEKLYAFYQKISKPYTPQKQQEEKCPHGLPLFVQCPNCK